MQEAKKRGLDIEAYLSTLTINIVMRCVGAIVRGTFIIVGLISIVGAILAGVVSYVAWLALPILVPTSFILGVVLLFK